jgi:hypothetical protein
MQDTNNALPPRWKDCSNVYPSVQEIVSALQDPGKSITTKRGGHEHPSHKYPLMEKLATKVYTSIRNLYKPDGLTKNVSRGKNPPLKEIMQSRIHMDVTELHQFFHSCAKDGKVSLSLGVSFMVVLIWP